MHGQYLEQQALTRPAGFYARGLSRRRVPRGPAIVVALSKRGRWGREVYIRSDTPRVPSVQTSRQNAAQVFGIWVTRLVSNMV